MYEGTGEGAPSRDQGQHRISKEYGELEQFLDSILEEKDDKARKQADLKESLEKKEYALHSDADVIRCDAMKRMVTPDILPEPKKGKARRCSSTIIRNLK